MEVKITPNARFCCNCSVLLITFPGINLNPMTVRPITLSFEPLYPRVHKHQLRSSRSSHSVFYKCPPNKLWNCMVIQRSVEDIAACARKGIFEKVTHNLPKLRRRPKFLPFHPLSQFQVEQSERVAGHPLRRGHSVFGSAGGASQIPSNFLSVRVSHNISFRGDSKMRVIETATRN
jgi:hypothetical protein